MGIGSFFAGLFSKRGEPAPPPSASTPITPADDAAAQARLAVRRLDRHNQPLDWAVAQQYLGAALISEASQQPAHDAARSLEEAAKVSAEAIAITNRETNAVFWASLRKLRGEALFRGAVFVDGDVKGKVLADAANDLAAALEILTPETAREMWVDAQIFRGAALQGLANLRMDGQGLAWLDEAAACFDEVARRGAQDGVIHPIGAYNRYVVLDERARRTPGDGALAYYTEARKDLLSAMRDKTFAQQPDLSQRVADLDAAMARVPR